MTDAIKRFMDNGSLLGAGFLPEGEELILVAEIANPAMPVEGEWLAATPILPGSPSANRNNETQAWPSARDALSLEEDPALASYLAEVASLTTAANAPAPDQPPEPSGNGIFVPFESATPFAGLEAVGVLLPT